MLDFIARSVAASWSDNSEVASLRIAQRLSMTLHRENARAILRRRVQDAVMVGPDELLNCLFDRVDQLVHGAERGWEESLCCSGQAEFVIRI